MNAADSYNAYVLSRDLIEKARLIQVSLPVCHFECHGQAVARDAMLRNLELAQQVANESQLLFSTLTRAFAEYGPKPRKQENHHETKKRANARVLLRRKNSLAARRP